MTIIIRDFRKILEEQNPPMRINGVLIDQIFENFSSKMKKEIVKFSDFTSININPEFSAFVKKRQDEKKINKNSKAYFNLIIIRTRLKEFLVMDSITLKNELKIMDNNLFNV